MAEGTLPAAAALVAALLLGGAPAAAPPQVAALMPARIEAGPWALSAPVEIYERDGLYGYIDGGAELFLQYGFERLELAHYAPAAGGGKKEIACEVYRMASPRDAFGIFSVKREGSESVSATLPQPNVFDAGQASFIRGPFYVNILGFDTTPAEIEAAARAIDRVLPFAAAPEAGPPWGRLPGDGRRPGTERFLRGELAAQGESDLLAEPFWGFAEGVTAVAARYGEPSSRLILIDLGKKAADILGPVRDLFGRSLRAVEVREGTIEARNGVGHVILFVVRNGTGILVVGRSGPEEARGLLASAVRMIAK